MAEIKKIGKKVVLSQRSVIAVRCIISTALSAWVFEAQKGKSQPLQKQEDFDSHDAMVIRLGERAVLNL